MIGKCDSWIFPEILGVSLKVEETGENQILIRQYYNGEDEPEENGCYYTFRFIDEYNVQLPDGTILYIEDTLKIRYEDKTEEISFSDLREACQGRSRKIRIRKSAYLPYQLKSRIYTLYF